jgi:hypothetical protein
MSLDSMVAPFALTRQASVAQEAVVDLEAAVAVGSYRPSIELVADDQQVEDTEVAEVVEAMVVRFNGTQWYELY